MGRFVFLAAVIAILVIPATGCIYAPFDLGLQDLGKVHEATLIDADAFSHIQPLRI